jgi:recombination protein RecA
MAGLSKGLASVLKNIEKTSPKLVRDVKENGRIKNIVSDSAGINYIFGGGIPIGRIVSIYGPFSSGKSSMCNYLAGQLQKKMPEGHRVVVYADFERSFDLNYATENGLDCTSVGDGGNFLFLQPDSLEEFFDSAQELVKTGEIACIILDSEAAAPTKTMMTDPSGKANFGSGAKAMTEGLRKMNIYCANYDTTMFVVSQERAQMCISENSTVDWCKLD